MIEQYKYFTYNITKFKGSRLNIAESNLQYFKKLKYDGFEVLHSTPNKMIFKIELQLIRKIKLKQLSNSFKKSVECRLLHIIKGSKERDEYPTPFTYTYGGYGTFGSGSLWSCSSHSPSDNTIDENVKEQYKEKNKYQSNQYNQKMKQYESKGRFRK